MDDGILSTYSFNIDIPKPRCYLKTHSSKCSKKTVKQKPKPLEKYLRKALKKPPHTSTTNDSVLNQRPISKDKLKRGEVVLSYKQFLKIQQAQQRKTRLAIRILDNIYSDLHRRMYVEDPPDDVLCVKHIDEDFFKSVDGRPLPHDHVAPFKSLKFLYHDLIRNKIEVGFTNDTILNIGVNHKLEQKKFEVAFSRCIRQMKNFDQFISEDYRRSMALLAESEKLKSKLEVQTAELSYLASEKFFAEAKLVGLDYMYKRLQKYGRFLHYLSPVSWRAQNREFANSVEIEAKGFDFGSSTDEDTFSVMFENMKKEYLCNLVKPALYFERPEELMEVFETIEKQQQYHFDHVTHNAPHAKTMYSSIKILRDIISLETAITATAVEDFKGFNIFYQTRGDQLEAKFYKILHGLFYECVGVPDVLKLRLHLEFCYEKVYGETPLSMDIPSIARALESFYMTYTKRLEELHSDKVQKAVKQYEESERLRDRRTKEATKELRLYDRLHHELQLAFKPSPARPKVPLPKWSSLKKKVKKRVKLSVETVKSKSLTEAEQDYLRLFTDWCSDEDPGDYLHTPLNTD